MFAVLVLFTFFQVKAPSPRKAMLYSAVFPAGGQFYTHNYIRGVLIAGTEAFLIGSLYVNYKEASKYSPASVEWNFYRKEAFSYGLYFLGVYLYSIADAYVSAHLFKVNRHFNHVAGVKTQ